MLRPFFSHCDYIFDIREYQFPYITIEGGIEIEGKEYTFEARCDTERQFIKFLEEWGIDDYWIDQSFKCFKTSSHSLYEDHHTASSFPYTHD